MIFLSRYDCTRFDRGITQSSVRPDFPWDKAGRNQDAKDFRDTLNLRLIFFTNRQGSLKRLVFTFFLYNSHAFSI